MLNMMPIGMQNSQYNMPLYRSEQTAPAAKAASGAPVAAAPVAAQTSGGSTSAAMPMNGAAVAEPVRFSIPDAADSKYTAPEMAVRARITPFDPAAVAEQEEAKVSGADEMFGTEEDTVCQTCEDRKYVDGSNDASVSFQTPQSIDPSVATQRVRGHEMEHVRNEQRYADKEGRKVVSQHVQLHSAICPECGKTYTSGGTTRTVTKADNAQQYQMQDEENEKKSTIDLVA